MIFFTYLQNCFKDIDRVIRLICKKKAHIDKSISFQTQNLNADTANRGKEFCELDANITLHARFKFSEFQSFKS